MKRIIIRIASIIGCIIFGIITLLFGAVSISCLFINIGDAIVGFGFTLISLALLILSIASIKEPVGIQDISAEIKRIANELVAEYKCIEEDISDCLRLHIYTSNNQKAATIKIMKSDLSIQLRKFTNGMPVSVSLSSAAELKNYF